MDERSWHVSDLDRGVVPRTVYATDNAQLWRRLP